MVASLVGGAILLFSCSGEKKGSQVNIETMITQQSDSLTMIFSKNGKKEYRFWTPLMERYEFARDPYMEFRYGINIVTFDSLGGDNSRLRADYAIFYEKRELWETRGNVVGSSADGRKLYTQQLFWDQKTDKVYSYVDSKIVDGDDEFVGEGFESDSEFNDWVFMESEGRMWVDASQGEPGAASEKKDEVKPTDGQKKEGSDDVKKESKTTLKPSRLEDEAVDEKGTKSPSKRISAPRLQGPKGMVEAPTDGEDEEDAPRSIMEREERIRKNNLRERRAGNSRRAGESVEAPSEAEPAAKLPAPKSVDFGVKKVE